MASQLLQHCSCNCSYGAAHLQCVDSCRANINPYLIGLCLRTNMREVLVLERQPRWSNNTLILGLPGNTNLNNDVIHNLTFVLILHPIAAGLAGLTVLFGFCGTVYSRIGVIFMTLTATLAGSCHPRRLGY
ncbi:hypothetical protein M422DRAFT_245710 [Sphaerobolus stellatus SS14]|nr:hypothetical protein M422DRAFT_245710 [Sphaerobolus stellatus SS14]